jgi:hypothetical protein
MISMAVAYFILIGWGFFGILQIAASHSQLYGLQLFPSGWKGYLAGTIITAAAFVWFFASGNRTIEGHITGVQGAEQFELILAGVGTGIALTALLVSVLRLKSKPGSKPAGYSLEQVRKMTYFEIILKYFKRKV